jgi:hypothetical protein
LVAPRPRYRGRGGGGPCVGTAERFGTNDTRDIVGLASGHAGPIGLRCSRDQRQAAGAPVARSLAAASMTRPTS